MRVCVKIWHGTDAAHSCSSLKIQLLIWFSASVTFDSQVGLDYSLEVSDISMASGKYFDQLKYIWKTHEKIIPAARKFDKRRSKDAHLFTGICSLA
jgi:hypothetical protein